MRNFLFFHYSIVSFLHPSFPNLTEEDVCSEIELSWLGVVLAAIKKSSDSCAGPDGIPFSIYRAFLAKDPELAVSIHDMLVCMAGGSLPPSGFNSARLFLLPKKTGGLIDDTRCISVTNSDNRIIATAVANSMAPAVGGVIDKEQVGFTPGRNSKGHKGLTNDFYESMAKKKQLYCLLLDTQRAFDTMSHDFIRMTLRAMSFPPWVLNMLEAVLSNVWVVPVLSAATKHKIWIKRGSSRAVPSHRYSSLWSWMFSITS